MLRFNSISASSSTRALRLAAQSFVLLFSAYLLYCPKHFYFHLVRMAIVQCISFLSVLHCIRCFFFGQPLYLNTSANRRSASLEIKLDFNIFEAAFFVFDRRNLKVFFFRLFVFIILNDGWAVYGFWWYFYLRMDGKSQRLLSFSLLALFGVAHSYTHTW